MWTTSQEQRLPAARRIGPPRPVPPAPGGPGRFPAPSRLLVVAARPLPHAPTPHPEGNPVTADGQAPGADGYFVVSTALLPGIVEGVLHRRGATGWAVDRG